MDNYEVDILQEGRLAVIHLPFDARSKYQQPKGTIFVRGLINDHPFRSRLLSKGNGRQFFSVTGPMRAKMGISSLPATVHLAIEQDLQEEKLGEPLLTKTLPGHSAFDSIINRKSIRTFTPEKLTEQQLQLLLNAGLCAPSAKNKRPWHFIVIQKRELLDTLGELGTHLAPVKAAPAAILVCGDASLEGTKEFLYASCGAAVQNILLAAHNLQLGGVWCGVPANTGIEKELIQQLGLVDKIRPVALLALGHPAEKIDAGNRFDENKIHFDSWNNRK